MNVTFAVALAILVLLASVLLAAILLPITPENAVTTLFPPFASLAGTFLGAWFAFRLQNQKKEQEKHSERLAVANRAIFTLAGQLNKLVLIRKQLIDPYRDSRARFLDMPPAQPVDLEGINVDVDSVSFLLETDTPDLLGDITIADAKYHATIDAVDTRSRLHQLEFQPKLEAAGFDQRNPTTLADVENAVGTRLFVSLQQASDQLIRHTDETITYLERTIDIATKGIKKLYPKETVITLKMPAEAMIKPSK